MATRVLPFLVTIPAGTPDTAPYVQAIDLDGWTLQRLDLEVPAGTAGLMGFQIYNNDVAWIPYGEAEWIIWDDVQQTYWLDDQPNAGGWAVHGYNTGDYDHPVTIRAHVIPATGQAPAPAPAVVTIQTAQVPSNEIVMAA